ncbi:MAG: class I SAM-dependent methyltransferase [Patescibacteria group bacterium]
MAYIYQKERQVIRERVADYIKRFSLKGRVLDVGAGNVLRYKEFFTQADQYLTQDHNQAEKFKHDYVCDAASIPAPDATFDVIICTQVLEHVPDPFSVMAEIARLLRSGGQLIISLPQANEIHEAPNDFYRYTKYGVQALADRCGLKVEEISGVGDYWTMRARDRQRFLIESLNLYAHPLAAKVFSVAFKLCYGMAGFLDKYAVSQRIKGRFTIGWTALLKKS